VTSPVALNFREALKWLGLIAGQAALLGALLFYFGWVRTQSLLRYFGLDNNIIQLSWNDYILRSPNVVIRGLTLACSISMLFAIGGALLWTYLAPKSRSFLWLSLLSYALAVAALALGLLGYFNIVIYSGTIPFVPIFFALAVGLLALGAALSSNADKAGFDEDAVRLAEANKAPSGGRAYHSLLGALAVLTVVTCGFWITSVYATQTGLDLAEAIEQDTTQRSKVIIYSESDLGFAPPVITRSVAGSRYKWQYSGLRYLIYAPEKYVLIPDNWRRGEDPTYIIPVDASIRVEIISS
jgi:hypothetical protein